MRLHFENRCKILLKRDNFDLLLLDARRTSLLNNNFITCSKAEILILQSEN